jgi:cell division protein FtsB
MANKRFLKISLVVALLLVIFLPPFIKYQEFRYKNKKLEERIKALKDQNKRLEEEKRRLETDITYIEKRARQNMGVVRKGEIIIKEE